MKPIAGDYLDLDGISLLEYDKSERNNYQYVVVEVNDGCPVSRDEIMQALHAENILARRYFWPGCHRMKPYSGLYPQAGLKLPSTHKVADRVIVLPTGAAIDKRMVETVVSVYSCVARE